MPFWQIKDLFWITIWFTLPDTKHKTIENQLIEPQIFKDLERVKGFNFLCTAPMHISLFVLSIGYVMVSHCQQAQYVHQFVHHLWGGGGHPHAARIYTHAPTQIRCTSC